MGIRPESPARGNAATPSNKYAIPNRRMTARVVRLPMVWETPLRTGNLRDPNGPQVTFAFESFIDELAAAAKADPIEFRLDMLARSAEDEIIGIHGVLKADVNGDGKLDLLANSAQPRGKFPDSAVWLEVPKNPRKADRWTRHVFAKNDAPGLSHYLGAGDLNSDGRLDITLAAKGGPSDKSGKGEWFAWWEAGEDPTKPFKKHRLPGVHPGATNILPADVNGDGKLDIVASRGHGTGLIWYENPGWKIHDINTELLSSHCLQVGDIDDDGDIDAVTCAYVSRKVAWFENDGKGKFTTHIIHNDQAAYDIRLVDMDADGDLDTLIAGQQSKNVVWFENPLYDSSKLHRTTSD